MQQPHYFVLSLNHQERIAFLTHLLPTFVGQPKCTVQVTEEAPCGSFWLPGWMRLCLGLNGSRIRSSSSGVRARWLKSFFCLLLLWICCYQFAVLPQRSVIYLPLTLFYRWKVNIFWPWLWELSAFCKHKGFFVEGAVDGGRKMAADFFFSWGECISGIVFKILWF